MPMQCPALNRQSRDKAASTMSLDTTESASSHANASQDDLWIDLEYLCLHHQSFTCVLLNRRLAILNLYCFGKHVTWNLGGFRAVYHAFRNSLRGCFCRRSAAHAVIIEKIFWSADTASRALSAPSSSWTPKSLIISYSVSCPNSLVYGIQTPVQLLSGVVLCHKSLNIGPCETPRTNKTKHPKVRVVMIMY
jgi:hypothetical protein